MKFKKVIKEVLLDPKHWFGWALTTGAIVGVLYLLGIHLYIPLYNVGILASVIIIVDLIKHITELQ